MSSGRPVVFRLNLSSFYGRSYTVVYRNDHILYNSTRPSRKIIRVPSEEDWDKFWKKSVSLKIWLWDREYLDRSTSDGSHWSVDIEIGKMKMRSYGSNIRPHNFDDFLNAVRKLLPDLELDIA
ncbi:MAG: hypothetical protein R6V47_06525 [Candidatus Delongbacteria bacterium]